MFRSTRFTRLIAPTCAVLLATGLAFVPTTLAQMKGAPDNSATNRNQNQNKTADGQPNAKSDVQLTAEIRRAVMADKTLSTYGHNVKIIVTKGAVTLKGPVHSDDEKRAIAAKAADAVGKDKVTNQIMVKQ